MSWTAVDLDGTLARHDGGGIDTIGEPVWPMVSRVKSWLAEGRDVRIFTARANPKGFTLEQHAEQHRMIRDWCRQHIGRELPICCCKDFACVEIWDDRAIQVIPNTGQRVGEADERMRIERGREETAGAGEYSGEAG